MGNDGRAFVSGFFEAASTMSAAPSALDPTWIPSQLALILGADAVVTDEDLQERYLVDWIGSLRGTASAVVKPADTAGVAACVRWCAEHGIPIVPQGGHTGLVGGATPVGDGAKVVISLERLNQVMETDPIGNTITVGAGVILENLQRAAEDADRYFPLSLGAEGSCQIGGCISTNAGGTAVLRYGNTRDLVLGLEVVLADGRVWSNLKALRKDNAGYDIKQLFIGSEGTLGIVTAATLRLYPKLRQRKVAMVGLDSADALLAFFVAARGAFDSTLTAFEFMTGASMAMSCRHLERPLPLNESTPYVVLLEVASASTVSINDAFVEVMEGAFEQNLINDAVIAANEQQAEFYWTLRESIPEAMMREFGPRRTGHDISVPIARIPQFLADLDVQLASQWPALGSVTFGHVGDGNLHLNFTGDADMPIDAFRQQKVAASAALYQLVQEYRGSISAEHGIGIAKLTPYEQHVDALQRELAAKLKRAFDCDALLNPGKVVAL